MKHLSDEVLCQMAQEGDANAVEQLVRRHARLVKTCTRPFFLAGADAEDLTQEGMLALMGALQRFQQVQGVSFEAFARICITRRIYSLIRSEHTKRNSPMHNSISLEEEPLFEDVAKTNPCTSLHLGNPEALVIGNEEREELMKQLVSLLSGFEVNVLNLYLQGLSYDEMSEVLQKPTKSVDNAIQRIRRKSANIIFS